MKRIIVTGGAGKAGRHAVQHFLDNGYQVLNLDLRPLDNPAVTTLITDITDSGQVFNALSHYTPDNPYNVGWSPGPVEGVVHFAAIPRIGMVPDNELFHINTQGTYNVIEAATKLGIGNIVIASSETVYGVCFAATHRDPEYVPLDEAYPVDPMDSYALSKVVNERTARAFALRTGCDITALRIGNVISAEQYADFPAWMKTPDRRKRIMWSYIDARDLGQIARLAIETRGRGFEIVNAAADDSSSDIPTAELLARFYPNVTVRGELGTFQSLLSNRHAREALGFRQAHHWRDEVAMLG
jgi:nucleoside-diphosphate-sugar epimerase